MSRCDFIFRNALVIDGTGADRILADVAVNGDRIAGVGDLSSWSAWRDMDVKRQVVAPGFIDVHTHDDNALLTAPSMAPKVSQGVTTVVCGNCGISLAPFSGTDWPLPLHLLGHGEGRRYTDFGDYVDALERSPPALNAAPLIGHNTLRFENMQTVDRPASERELLAMQTQVRDGMQAGAIGFSTGLDYESSVHASTEEVVALAAVAAAHGGIYASHTRDYFERVLEALDEAFEIARRAGAELIISHHQVSGRENFGKSAQSLAMIRAAREAQPVGLDAYPYAASSKVLDPERAKPGVRILVTWSLPHPQFAGRYLDDVAVRWDCSNPEAARRLLPAGAVYFQLCEDDVEAILQFAETMIGSDGLPHDEFPHPRLWGTFPRVLGHYARDRKLFTLEEAVRRMTGLPALRFGLSGRGLLAPGEWADLVVFDPDSIRDEASFLEPLRPATGITMTMVNGQPVWENGASTGHRPGRLLRRAKTPGKALVGNPEEGSLPS